MRIKSVIIDKYVTLRDKRFDMGDGLTVLHGPNESGKTTTMDFIRRGLVPTKRQGYPAADDKGSGRMIVDDGGIEMTVEIKNKKPRERPECVSSLDPDTYRSIYAMTPSELIDSKTMVSSEIRSRFISTPGGENMPKTKEWIKGRFSDLLGAKSNSPSVYNEADARIAELNSLLIQQKTERNQYSNLEGQKQELVKRKNELEASNAEMSEKIKLRDNHRYNKDNYGRLKELNDERANIGQFKHVTEEEIRKKDRLDESIRRAEDDRNAIVSDLELHNAKIGNIDPKKVVEKRDSINRLRTDKDLYAQRLASRATSRAVPTDAPAPKKKASPIIPVVIMIASLAIGAGIYFSTESLIGTIAVPVVGIVISAILLLMGRSSEQIQESVPVSQSEDYSQWLDAYEAELKSTLISLGISPENAMSDVDHLRYCLEVSEEIIKKRNELNGTDYQLMSAKNAKLEFLQAYGGEEGFERSKGLTKRSTELDREIKAVRGAISNCGLDPDHPEYEDFEDPDMTEFNEINKKLGAINQHIDTIMKKNDVEATQNELDRQESIRDDALKAAAEAILAGYIVDDACKRISEDVQPGVCETADRYLSLMTGDRYRLDRDPTTADLTIVSKDGSKRELKQCSSGLTAQFMLSMKMAIAKEMGKGCVPMILDDVLLTFDSERKRGAIEALEEISSEMQVILFTCDDQTRDFATESGAKVIEMEV